MIQTTVCSRLSGLGLCYLVFGSCEPAEALDGHHCCCFLTDNARDGAFLLVVPQLCPEKLPHHFQVDAKNIFYYSKKHIMINICFFINTFVCVLCAFMFTTFYFPESWF